jgi:uncharacterized protein (TIGR02145 family)
MKEAGYDHWNEPNFGATNSSGFNGFPGSYCNLYNGFGQEGDNGYWWSSSLSDTNYPLKRDLHYYDDTFFSYSGEKFIGFSARCVRDD